jgi:hypothetical protein
MIVTRLQMAERAIFDRRTVGACKEALQDWNARLTGVESGDRTD